jgi:Glycosyl hydrolases family 39
MLSSYPRVQRTRLTSVLPKRAAIACLWVVACSQGTAQRGMQGGTSPSSSLAASSSSGAAPAPDAGQGAPPGNAEPFAPARRVSVVVTASEAKPVAPSFFGQNYWSWVPEWGDPVAGVVSQTAELGLGLLRAGGANNDTQQPVPFSQAEIDDFVAFSLAVGAEPLLQIPVLDDGTGVPTSADQAAELVRYTNRTGTTPIRNFSIGNEPDLYIEQGHQAADYDAASFCETFAAFSTAMRAVDPGIRIFGPDLSWKYQVGGEDWLTPFLEQCGDQLDVVSVHRYPYAPAACDEAAALGDGEAFRSTIASVRSILEATGQGAKPLAFTEANITYDGSPETSVEPASPGTFLAALWLADSLGVALEEQIFSMNYWSLSEGWSLGFFDGTTPRPAYHVLRLVSQNFGTEVLKVTSVPDGLRVYSGRDSNAGFVSVVALNLTAEDVELEFSLDPPANEAVVLPLRAKALLVARLPDGGAPVLYPYTSRMATAGIAP